jgi:hypothetical protein
MLDGFGAGDISQEAFTAIKEMEAERDALERIVRVLGESCVMMTEWVSVWDAMHDSREFAPGDFEILRSLITPEGETGERA